MVLPVLNTFAGNPLDRAGDQRSSPDWLAEQAASPEALACVFWDGQPLLEDHADGPRLTWLALSHARDMIRDGEDGFLCPQEDVLAIAARLRQLAGDLELRRRLGANARATAERAFDARVLAERLLGQIAASRAPASR